MNAEKEAVLHNVATQLKARFVGLDKIIDDFISKVKIWYCYPEFLFRPIIISMYGLTGVGKTELVHTFVKLLNLHDHFATIDLGNAMNDSSSMSYILSMSNIQCNSQGILLIDEIQKAYQITGSIDKYSVINNGFWSLLSNGRVTNMSDKISRIQSHINTLRNDIRSKNRMLESMMKTNPPNPDGSANENFEQFRKSLYQGACLPPSIIAEYIDKEDVQNLLQCKFGTQGFEETQKDYIYINQIVGYQAQMNAFAGSLSVETVLNLLEYKYHQMLYNQNRYTDDDFIYKQLLIIINGNLDGLFIPKTKQEFELTCEDVSEHIKTITPSHIRQELFKLFKPEQVSRFGSNFIIFPGLEEQDFLYIISLEINKWIAIIKERYNIDMSGYANPTMVLQKVKERGFFPSQGVRPVVSAVNAIMGELVPEYLSSINT